MGERPLRQHYEGLDAQVDDELFAVYEPWRRHRDRFIAALGAMSEEQASATTRCTEWDAKDILTHLVSADGFWVLTLGNSRTGAAPTKFLQGFDPSSSLDPIIDAQRDVSFPDQLTAFKASTDALAAEVAQWDGEDWDMHAESPFGHLAARFIFAHAFWDSWLHERDTLVPLGLAGPVETDELLVAAWFTLFVAGAQGGLLGDNSPVGAGLGRPVDVTISFDDIPGRALRVRYDEAVRIEVVDPAHAKPAGRALDLVEGTAGRAPTRFDTIPDDELAAQIARAAMIL
ncbi:MAG TPA: maleylpyruvate isomerase N-terminal domain-containing protein [Acidimicrobiia bacterium]|nr:maleylpyruvate isomerase N-terminal domain-containing protein [Acidimicrobiia bacterium]